jgi:hypothetical protein
MNNFIFILFILIFFFIIKFIISHLYIYNQNNIYLKNVRHPSKVNLPQLISNNKLKKPLQTRNKILIITFDNRNDNYITAHNNNLKKYSKKWNIDYKFYNKCNKNIYWCKIHLISDALKSNKYDFVMWLDSDTYIKNMNINLSDILNQYNSDIFIASDNNKFSDLVNAGVFIIKNSKIGKQFIEECISSFYPECLNCDNSLKGRWAGFCYEQGIMNILIANKYRKYTTILTNDIIYNGFKCVDNVFILHYYGSKVDTNYIKDRDKCFKPNKNI